MSKIDEAVEVARHARMQALIDANGSGLTGERINADAMRAAILAALTVMLGEPAAWRWRHPNVNEGDWILANEPPSDEHRFVGWMSDPLYAPSLGEGHE